MAQVGGVWPRWKLCCPDRRGVVLLERGVAWIHLDQVAAAGILFLIRFQPDERPDLGSSAAWFSRRAGVDN